MLVRMGCLAFMPPNTLKKRDAWGPKTIYPDAIARFLACPLHIIGIGWICDELLAAVVGISRIMHGLDK